MGMGLSICRAIIEAHHGHIRTFNNPKGGATFEFVLPLVSEAAPQTGEL
jgi:two-component system sensor histidine kinase KdpD